MSSNETWLTELDAMSLIIVLPMVGGMGAYLSIVPVALQVAELNMLCLELLEHE